MASASHIYLASPHMSDEGYEQKYIQEAFASNWIAPLGSNVDQFEQEIAQKLGARHAVALSAGTAAIHLALKSAEVGQDDVVFCQSLTFSASANPIVYQNLCLLTATGRHGICHRKLLNGRSLFIRRRRRSL